jgi:hypothetical protein
MVKLLQEVNLVLKTVQWVCRMQVTMIILIDGGHAQSRGTSIASSDLDADHDPQLPIRVRKLSDIVADLDDQEVQLHVVSPDEPEWPEA